MVHQLGETGPEYYGSGVEYLGVESEDAVDVDIASFVPTVVPWINQQLAAERKVLVHCVQGVNRSGSMVVAAVALLGGLDIVQAAASVQRSRCGRILTNLNFRKSIVRWAATEGLLPPEGGDEGNGQADATVSCKTVEA